MRLFISINFDKAAHSKLIALRDNVRSFSVRGSFVQPENLHLTLAFLGDCSSEQVSDIKKAMKKTAFTPFDIYIDSLGRFRRDGSHIWWAGIRENKTLLKLQSNLSDNLIRAGFELDKGKYKPHITLGRKVVSRAAPSKVEPFKQTVTGIDLMESESFNNVLIYTSIYRVP